MIRRALAFALVLLFCGPGPILAQELGVRLRDGSQAGEADVLGSTPGGTEQGLVVRPIPSGTQTVDSELPAAAAAADNAANPTVPGVAAYLFCFDGVTWDRCPGTSTDGLLVNLGLNNDVTITGTVTVTGTTFDGILRDGTGDTTQANVSGGRLHVDGSGITQPISAASLPLPSGAATETTLGTRLGDSTFTGRLPAGVSPADNESNTSSQSRIGAYLFCFDGTTWDRCPGNSVDGLLVNLGANNDVTVTGTVTANQGTAAAGSSAWPIAVTNTSDTVVKPGDSVNNAVRVNIVAGGGAGGTSATDNSAFTGGSTAVTPMGAIFDASPPTITDGNVGAPRMSSSRILLVDCQSGCAGASDTVGGTTALNALNAAASVALSGQQGAEVFIAAGTLAGTVVAEISHDGGTTWVSAVFLEPTSGATATSIVFTNPSAATSRAIGYLGPITHARVRVSAFTSGTADGTLRSTATRPFVVVYGSDGTNLRAARMATDGTVRVDPTGTTTQPISAASLPLPSGAATSANQDGIIRDGTGDTTQANVSVGRLHVDPSGVTSPISAASLPLPTGASTLAEQQTQTTALQLIDDVVHADNAALGKVTAIGCQFDDTTPGTTTENNVRALRCTTRRELHTVIRDGAGNERSANVNASNELNVSAAVTSVPANQSVNLNQLAGNAISSGNGVAGTGTVRVSVASDSTGQIGIVPLTSGGLSISRTVSAASTNATNVKASAGQVFAIVAANVNAEEAWVHLYNTAGTPTCTTSIIASFIIPGATTGGGTNIPLPPGAAFATGIGFCLTTAPDGTGAVAASEVVLNVFYK